MSFSSLDQLYRQVVLDHAKNPRHYKELDHPTQQMELLNPSCGDAIMIQLEVQDDQITDVGFKGHGCSISMASASMMTEVLLGQSIQQAERLIDHFGQLIQSQETIADEWLDALKDASLLEGVRKFPLRYNCAILPWRAAQMSLSDQPIELEDDLVQGSE